MNPFMAVIDGIPSDERKAKLAEALARVHGFVSTRREESGDHFYLPCPICVEMDGRKELKSRHFAINVDQYFGIGVHALQRLAGTKTKARGKKKTAENCTLCMKNGAHQFTVETLLRMPTLEQRGWPDIKPQVSGTPGKEKYLVPDDMGNMIPDHPGKVIGIQGIPNNHPIHEFLSTRRYDMVQLNGHIRIAYCLEQAPEGEQYGNRFYRSHTDNWKSTPQGRVIFYVDMPGRNGMVQRGWQARYLEISEDLPNGRKRTRVWHPYRQEWNWIHDDQGELLPIYGGTWWPPVKYLTAPGSSRNNTLMGYPSVVAAAQSRAHVEIPTCVICEGPLDAARFPGYGLAVLGKFLSENQILLISARFRRVIIAFDNDKAGLEATKGAELSLGTAGIPTVRFWTEEEYAAGQNGWKMDAGAMTYGEARERMYAVMDRFQQ
jgi:hypothetical protein